MIKLEDYKVFNQALQAMLAIYVTAQISDNVSGDFAH